MTYSIYNRRRLVRTYVAGQVMMIGCSVGGKERAKRAGVARIRG